MSGNMSGGVLPSVTATPQWAWNTAGTYPQPLGYPPGGAVQPTKTGLMPGDLQNFVGVPMVYYGNPSSPVNPAQMVQWLRWSEDWVEKETSVLLCQSWVAAPPAVQPGSPTSISLQVSGNAGQTQQLGVDYDVYDAAYDFLFPRAQDEGWMNYSLRYRPIRQVVYDTGSYNPVKRLAYIYPLLNEFFQVPPNWIITDEDKGMIRLVPATNVQMLPLFALQLSFMGFADSVPGGLWFQYIAGLTPADLMSRYSHVLQLVLAHAAIMGLAAVQSTINLGALSTMVGVDGLQYETRYPEAGPYSGLIKRFERMEKDLLLAVKSKVAGPSFTVL